MIYGFIGAAMLPKQSTKQDFCMWIAVAPILHQLKIKIPDFAIGNTNISSY
jgi:hypothetical protein